MVGIALFSNAPATAAQGCAPQSIERSRTPLERATRKIIRTPYLFGNCSENHATTAPDHARDAPMHAGKAGSLGELSKNAPSKAGCFARTGRVLAGIGAVVAAEARSLA